MLMMYEAVGLFSILSCSSLVLVAGGQESWYKYNSIGKYYNFEKNKKSCQEKSLEARERDADVIFTGTIREMVPDWEHPETMKAKVEIKRVMKGGYVLSRMPRLPFGGMTSDLRRVVIVDGIGDPSICMSEARTYDTRIFLTTKSNNGELRLNSSLVRITLQNIETAEAAVQDVVLNKAHKGNIIEKALKSEPFPKTVPQMSDPCKHFSCSFGAHCTVNSSTGRPLCRCSETCPPDLFAPVCGSDGVTYGNECLLKSKNCITQKMIAVHSQKPCDPCRSKQCSYGARCVASLDGNSARCQCPERCDSFGDTVDSGGVCGTDGHDYESLCEMKKRSCEEMKEIEKKYDGKCDPCDGFHCSLPHSCQLDSSRRPVCSCDDPCSMIFDPVCGSNGKTYSNECIMKVDRCRLRIEITMLFRGECSSGSNPCSGVVCGPGEHCLLDPSNTARCFCPQPCQPVLKPVCGDNGQTYQSECHLRRNSCIDKQIIGISHGGQCNAVNPCLNYKCQAEAHCVLRNHRPLCVCPVCSEEYEPVCGDNDISYANECKLRFENCENLRKNVTIRHKGLCNICENKKCDFYSTCNIRSGGQCTCPSKCNETEAKVCGTDGITYMNECELRVYSCRQQQLILVASQGPCDPCANVKCRSGTKCENGRCGCHYTCPNVNEPVCGSNGLTYPSECAMQRAACSQSVNIEAVHAGSCELIEDNYSGSGDGLFTGFCDTKFCRFGGICVTGRRGEQQCTCNFNCDAIRSPVCGANGKTYGNKCQLEEEICRQQKKIEIQPMENCEDILDDEMCDGKPALVNPMTGLEYMCDDKTKTCPASSYCHKLSGIGRCCSEDQPMRSCMDSEYGCCPDRITASSGPNASGCPSACRCHVLGSNSSLCHPVTRQCTCKPGVSGLKCDSCSQTFWGLRTIAEGNNGCIPCGCNINGSVREDCEQMTGRCNCKAGITGQKCDKCPSGKRLELTGCTDHLMFNDHLTPALTCSDMHCYYGAICQMTNGIPDCICPATCRADDDRLTVCGSDGQEHGSACRLRRFSCRLQKDITVASIGSCIKNISTTTAARTTTTTTTTTTTPSNFAMLKSPKLTNSRVRVIKDLTNPTNLVSIYGSLGDFCQEDKDCFARGSYCKNGLCSCKGFFYPSTDNMACTDDRFVIPSFAGDSYIRLKRMNHGSRDISVEVRFQPQRDNGILLYAGQDMSGKGDFLSLSIKNGFIEFRYDLGSGAALLKSAEKVKLGAFHKVTAMRFRKDGTLKLDEGHEVSSTSPGMLRSLNLVTPVFLGFLPNMTDIIIRNAGLNVGFVGCIESLILKSSEFTKSYDLAQDSSTDVEHQDGIRECGTSVCTNSPCLNGGTCVELDAGINFQCQCSHGFSGVRCEHAVKLACAPENPCHFGGTCLDLGNGRFVCNCLPHYEGERCERALGRQHSVINRESITIPQFHGDSYIVTRLGKTVGHSVSFEIWFLPFESDGVLLYAAQENVIKGDFLSLNLVGGYAQLRYNLGSGIANITSQTKVKLGMWNKVTMSRKNRLSSLRLNDDNPSTGQSGGEKNELNLPTMKIYIGGYPHRYNPDSQVKSNFVGAIQKFFKDEKLLENLLSESVSLHRITQYDGPPCPVDRDVCHNNGTCIPNLNDFECSCVKPFTGSTCEIMPKKMSVGNHNMSNMLRSIAFNGRVYHRYKNIIAPQNVIYLNDDRTQVNNKFEIKFRTETRNGLLLMMHKSNTAEDDYLAIAINSGHVQISFNLGKEHPSRLLYLNSHLTISDGVWHSLTFARKRRHAQLSVDHEHTATFSAVGANHLETDGHIWIGGCKSTPRGLPKPYSQSFKGCIEFVKVNDQLLDMVEDRDMRNEIAFCDNFNF